GGPGAAMATVSQDFDVHIDHYIWVGLLGLIKLIDAIGGIDVVTSHPVLDDYYPADVYGGWPYDYERVAVLGGPQHLDGIHAMQYVRSRHGDLQSDFGRSQHQPRLGLDPAAGAHVLPMISRIFLGDALAVLMLICGPMTYLYLGTKTSKVAEAPSKPTAATPRAQALSLAGTLYIAQSGAIY